jgi:hypothetical protein
MSHPQSDREIELIQTFEKNSSRLYSLAFLLTGDMDRSVEAFDKALDIDEPVRDGFMDEWTRRLVIIAALSTMERELLASIRRTLHLAGEEPPGSRSWKRRARIASAEFEKAVLAIDTFPRCAMLLTIFEGMSIKLASVLLDANEALTQVAQRVGIVQLTRNLAAGGGQDAIPRPG